MEWLTTFLALTAGLLLRLALPIAVTAVAVYLLRKLDARWQAAAESFIDSPAQDAARPQCWILKDCPPARLRTCPVPMATAPCWQVRRQRTGDLQEACLNCDVFLEAPLLRAHAHA